MNIGPSFSYLTITYFCDIGYSNGVVEGVAKFTTMH